MLHYYNPVGHWAFLKAGTICFAEGKDCHIAVLTMLLCLTNTHIQINVAEQFAFPNNFYEDYLYK